MIACQRIQSVYLLCEFRQYVLAVNLDIIRLAMTTHDSNADFPSSQKLGRDLLLMPSVVARQNGPRKRRAWVALDLQPAHLSFSAFDVRTIEFMLGCAPLPCVEREPRNEAQLGKMETRNFPCCPPRGPKPQRRLFFRARIAIFIGLLQTPRLFRSWLRSCKTSQDVAASTPTKGRDPIVR